eukprot:m.383701 g.383701  ORF g.383701 m.383701 type:complete len:262 (+) comp20983_c1_seq2:145-930(+)
MGSTPLRFACMKFAQCTGLVLAHACLKLWLPHMHCSDGGVYLPQLLVNPTQVPDGSAVVYDWGQIGASIFRGVSQVFLQNNSISGVLIVLGMCICAPVSAFFAVFGSVISTATALGLGVAAGDTGIYAGLYAYNGVLAAIAMGKLPSQTLLFVVIGAVLSTILTAATTAVFAPTGLPVGTFPFVLASWLMHMTSHAVVEARQTQSADAFRPFSPRAQIRAVERVRMQVTHAIEFCIVTRGNGMALRECMTCLVCAFRVAAD